MDDLLYMRDMMYCINEYIPGYQVLFSQQINNLKSDVSL